MRASVLRMISTGSLSAFSASITNGSLGNGSLGGVAGAAPVQKVFAARSQPQQAAPAQQSAGGRPVPQMAPGQIMPRGSLLDLSV